MIWFCSQNNFILITDKLFNFISWDDNLSILLIHTYMSMPERLQKKNLNKRVDSL